ncbi:hypothetical protein DBT_0979 [Dissulfuribacter thermophilus]|uniref:PqqD family protein n=1 Tax=Dissulfuribacter thermophilus TaxID=1156395 RepID=A0A1B9F6P5_9BACT|nr:PqqD family peptide modification chaperone [Dissulfuribacter thermophilus]OCC15628.1 hypothetical protein DBT_0979 [Dissulfuribacter thermophilus]
MEGKIVDQTIFQRTDGKISADLEGEEVILDMDSGMYFGLNEVGQFIWKRLEEPSSFRSLLDSMLSEYDVTEEQCRQDLKTFLNALLEAGLIQLVE